MIVQFLRPCFVGTHSYAIDETGDIPTETARALLQSEAVCEALPTTPKQAASPKVREVTTKARKVETRG